MNQPNDMRTIPLLTHLRSAELKQLARLTRECACDNREVIFREDMPCAGLYIVKEGRVKLLHSSGDKVQLFALASAGDPLDLVPFLDGGPHSVTAVARGPVIVYFVECGAAREMIWNTPALFSTVLTSVSAHLRNLAAIASDLAFKDVTARVCKILLDQAESEGKRNRREIRLDRTLSRQEFASLAGTAREVAWRSLKKLEKDGLVKIERHQITLLDPERLAAMV